jgi:hypothetical protein
VGVVRLRYGTVATASNSDGRDQLDKLLSRVPLVPKADADVVLKLHSFRYNQ